MRQMVVS